MMFMETIKELFNSIMFIFAPAFWTSYAYGPESVNRNYYLFEQGTSVLENRISSSFCFTDFKESVTRWLSYNYNNNGLLILSYLNNKDTSYCESIYISRSEERAHIKYVRDQVNHFRREIEAEDFSWASGRRKEYLLGLIAIARKKLLDLKLLCGRLALREKKEGVRKWLMRLSELSPYEGRIEELKKKIHLLARPKSLREGNVTPEMIERARDRSMDDFLDPLIVAKRKMACPWHDDRNPSMMIRGGFGYCFVCRKRLGAIDWLMLSRGMSFVEAVKALQ